MLKNEKAQESTKNIDRIQILRTVERLKQPLSLKASHSTSSKSIHSLLYEMGKRHRPAFVVNGEYVESESSGGKKERGGRLETESLMKSVGSVKSLKNLHTIQMTPRILQKNKEIVKTHEGILKNILKNGGIGGVFKDTLNDFSSIGIHCKTTRALSDSIYHGIVLEN